MRNLKKFLALVMAFVMAMSLMVTANAAYYTNKVDEFGDKDEITEEFQEAAGVLTGMQVFQGDEKGFRPASTITRAETAALIYRIATGDVKNEREGMYANYGNFSDVNPGDWFAGYVGYCANAGYIKGTTPTTFNPYAPVTGYEALAMILRAVGYDKNGEFTGPSWQVNVSALATRLGVLDDVSTTQYGGTLYLAARRDVVASLLFNTTAYVKTVTWTPALGYETTESTGSSSDYYNTRNLGWMNFGLSEIDGGVIVGNQDTGESNTQIKTLTPGSTTQPGWYKYLRQTKSWDTSLTTAAAVDTGVITSIDAKTGLDKFGHAIHVWYCGANANGAKKGNTFWMEDLVKKTALVTAANETNTAVLSTTGGTYGTTDTFLGQAAQRAGFKVNLSNSETVFNYSFGVSDLLDHGQASRANLTSPAAMEGGAAGGYPLYLLISNNSGLTVDMVVALNVEVTTIAQTDNVTTFPTVTLPLIANVDTFVDAANEPAVTIAGTSDYGKVEVAALTGESNKGLGDKVVGIAVSGTNTTSNTAGSASAAVSSTLPAATTWGIGTTMVANYGVGYDMPATSPLFGTNVTENLFYNLRTPSKTVEGTVSAYNYVSAADVAANAALAPIEHTGSITFTNGETYERSLLADTISALSGLSASANLYGNYRLYLDAEGKYIWAEPIYDNSFIYGTYVDYTTALGSSTFEYTMVGVNLNGERVERKITTLDGQPIDGTIYGGKWTSGTAHNGLGVIFRDTLSTVANWEENGYVGYSINEKGDLISALTGTAAQPNSANYYNLNPMVYSANQIITTAGVTITRNDAHLGMAPAAAAATTPATYFTDNTKFIVVGGAGTDSQTIKVYKGLTELLDGGTSVTIRGNSLNALGLTSRYIQDDANGPNLNELMYYTRSPFTYASVANRADQVDTIILPEAALSYTGRTNLAYLGNPASNADLVVGPATNHFWQHTVYIDGEAQNVWLGNFTAGTDTIAAATDPLAAATGDQFYTLRATSWTMPNGDPVYEATAVTAAAATAGAVNFGTNGYPTTTDMTAPAAPVIWGAQGTNNVLYSATTYDAQTATLTYTGSAAGGNRYRVAGAKVVNLNNNLAPAPGLVWPNITSLSTLNDAGSVGTSVTGATATPRVSCLVDANDPTTITTIYVCWNQSAT